MSNSPATPYEALMAFLRDHRGDDGAQDSVRAAHRLGEAAAESDLTIEETFELLEQEASDLLPDLSATVLGSIVRGYVDQVVRMRGHTHRRGTGRLSSHVARLAALHRINRAATGSLHLDAMLSTVVEVVNETIGGDACSVFLHDPHSNALILRATVGLNPDTVGRLAIRADSGITGIAATSRQTQVVINAREHPAFFTYPTLGEDPYTSQVSIPLLLREPERLVGVMNIQSIVPREFDLDEVTFLETAAGELAIAIENARLYGQTDAALSSRINELHTLQFVMRSIASTLRAEELVPMIVNHARELTRGDAAAVFRVDELTERLTPAGFASDPDRDDACPETFPQTFVDTIVRNRSAMALPSEDGDGDHIMIGAPLMTGHGILGVVCARFPASENHAEAKLGIFQAFADSAALAFDNADLYEEARHGYATASTLLQEMHHRVRNNLQTVAALLSMQARHATSSETKAPLREAVARVQSIAAVHNLLSAENLTAATITSIAKHVVDEATITVVPPGLDLRFEIEPSEVEASSRQATLLALLINECVTNAIEHGMAGRERGLIRIVASEKDGEITVAIEDDGNGLPENFRVEDSSRLGLRIARTLAASDLNGSFALEARDGGGARSVIRFPSRR
jgi:two-component sensor histidine kinase/putative methionine-R-sulfoxide reductase with GAF domain